MDFSRQTHNLRSVLLSSSCIHVQGALIVGAGPPGLAVAACLQEKGISIVVLEGSDCIASLWQFKTNDGQRAHWPKQFYQLPLMEFPADFPAYATNQQFVKYLEAYAREFAIEPRFNQTVTRAEYDATLGFWRVESVGINQERTEYVCRWFVVATGENVEAVVLDMEDMRATSSYESGEEFRGKRVLVAGCENWGMEVCLDLCKHDAQPSLVIKDSVRRSTLGLFMWLQKWLPNCFGDLLLLKCLPNLFDDLKWLAKIKSGDFEVCPGIERINRHAVEFLNGETDNFDAIILATGYKSNVPSWLKGRGTDGSTPNPLLHGWKGEHGLYAVGFTELGWLSISRDAEVIAEDMVQAIRKLNDFCYG